MKIDNRRNSETLTGEQRETLSKPRLEQLITILLARPDSKVIAANIEADFKLLEQVTSGKWVLAPGTAYLAALRSLESSDEELGAELECDAAVIQRARRWLIAVISLHLENNTVILSPSETHVVERLRAIREHRRGGVWRQLVENDGNGELENDFPWFLKLLLDEYDKTGSCASFFASNVPNLAASLSKEEINSGDRALRLFLGGEPTMKGLGKLIKRAAFFYLLHTNDPLLINKILSGIEIILTDKRPPSDRRYDKVLALKRFFKKVAEWDQKGDVNEDYIHFYDDLADFGFLPTSLRRILTEVAKGTIPKELKGRPAYLGLEKEDDFGIGVQAILAIMLSDVLTISMQDILEFDYYESLRKLREHFATHREG